MKKTAIIIFVVFVVCAVTGRVFAETDADYARAMKYYNSGQYKKAVELFKEQIKIKPEAASYYRIGYALYKLKKFDEGREYFQQAYFIDPQFSPWEMDAAKKYPLKKRVKKLSAEKQAPAAEEAAKASEGGQEKKTAN